MNVGRLPFRAVAGLFCAVVCASTGPAQRAIVDPPHRLVFTPAGGESHRGIELIRSDAFSYVPYDRAGMVGDANATANFIVTYTGFTPQAQAAFQYAVNIWADVIVSNVPIRVDARFVSLAANTLGQAGPTRFWRNFPNSSANTFFADPIADKIAGTDICSLATCAGDPDIEAEFSSAPAAPWYFGLDARPPGGTTDFVTVVLHELGHGLGFIGSGTRNSAGFGVWGLSVPPVPLSFDRYVRTGTGKPYISNPTPSAAALADLTSDNLFFASPAAADSVAISSPARLYAPSTFRDGSTYSHLDEATYPAGSANSLMTPQIRQAEAIHNPGPVMREILSDIGWGATAPAPAPAGAPGRPTVTRAEATGGILNVAWTLAAGASPTAHRLDFFSGGAPVATVNAGSSTSIAIPIPPGTAGVFTVRVTAFNGATASPTSDPFAFSLGAAGCTSPPAPPPGVSGAVVNGTATVRWNTSSGATSYIVQAGASPGGAEMFNANVGSATMVSASGLPPGFRAYVRIIAVNACGRSASTADFLVQ
jgi:hypothetical protein